MTYPFPEDRYHWQSIVRLSSTIFGFIGFAMGSVLLSLVIFPIIYLTGSNKQYRNRRVRLVIKYAFKFFLVIMQSLRLIQVDVDDMQAITALRGTFIICNHPSLLDVAIIMAQLGDIQCVVKHDLWHHPIFGLVMRAAGYISNNINPNKLLADCTQQLRYGTNIIIFPEGTRSTPNKPLKLLRGLGNLALAANADIQALIMYCTPPLLTKQDKWYKMPKRRVLFQLRVGDIFYNAKYQTAALRSIRVRALVRDIQQYYNRNLGYE